MVLEVVVDFFDELCVVSTVFVQPKRNNCFRCLSSGNREFDPVLDGCVFYGTHPPDIPLINFMLQERCPIGVANPHGASSRKLKRFVVAPIFLCLLSH